MAGGGQYLVKIECHRVFHKSGWEPGIF